MISPLDLLIIIPIVGFIVLACILAWINGKRKPTPRESASGGMQR